MHNCWRQFTGARLCLPYTAVYITCYYIWACMFLFLQRVKYGKKLPSYQSSSSGVYSESDYRHLSGAESDPRAALADWRSTESQRRTFSAQSHAQRRDSGKHLFKLMYKIQTFLSVANMLHQGKNTVYHLCFTSMKVRKIAKLK